MITYSITGFRAARSLLLVNRGPSASRHRLGHAAFGLTFNRVSKVGALLPRDRWLERLLALTWAGTNSSGIARLFAPHSVPVAGSASGIHELPGDESSRALEGSQRTSTAVSPGGLLVTTTM